MTLEEIQAKYPYGYQFTWATTPSGVYTVVGWPDTTGDDAGIYTIRDGELDDIHRWDLIGLKNTAPYVDRPKIRDTWGVLINGTFIGYFSEHDARRFDNETVARVINGVICDEHGTPYETETP